MSYSGFDARPAPLGQASSEAATRSRCESVRRFSASGALDVPTVLGTSRTRGRTY